MKNRKDNMTIKQMIKQAEKVYAWVQIHDEDGAYIQVKKADLFGQKYGIKGVPTFIVNGKYAVSGNREIGTKDLLDVVDFLIAKERKQ